MKKSIKSLFYFQSRLLLSSLIVAITALFVQASFANEQQAEEWHYTLRPGDNLQKVSQGFLNRQHTWTDLIRHNKIEQVSSLASGSIIKIPMHWLKYQPRPAKVKSLTGSAQIKRASQTTFKVLKTTMQIRVGDELATREGNVLIEFADGSTVRLEENSNLVFNKLSHFGKTGMVDTRLRLKKGSLSTEVTPLVKGSRYEITTPSAVAAVRGTKFRLVSEDQATKIEVIEGSVDFSGPHGKTIVSAGQGARIKKGSARIEHNTLPDAPKPLFADSKIRDLPTKLSWQEQPTADQYKVQLTDNNKQDQLVKSAKTSKPELELQHIENGEYDLSMRSINGKGFEGIDSVTKLSIDIATEKPTLLAPLDRSIIESLNPKFIWQLNDKSILGKLQLSKDRDFNLIVTKFDFNLKKEIKLKKPLMPGTYYWRVLSMAEDSEQIESDVRSFSIRGKLSPVKILSVNYVDSQVGLFWKKIDNAQGYILQVSDTKEFKTILKEQTIGKAKAHLRLSPGKHYYARVKGISADLFTSEFGPTKELFIDEK
jgi:hypothetical protein